MGIATSSQGCLTKATQAAARLQSPVTKRSSVKGRWKVRNTYRRGIAGSKENNGFLERHCADLQAARSGLSFVSKFTKGEIMKMRRILVVLVGLTLLFAGNTLAQQVKTDYDRSANFAQYKTYSWE